MADTDLIACLYAFGAGDASEAVKKKANRSRFVGPPPSPPTSPHEQVAEDEYTRLSRHSTEEPDPQGHWDTKHLEFRFSHGPQTRHGFVFGWDPKSDVVLPVAKGISFHHFALTFDNDNRLIVRDLGSLIGTQVTYDDEGRGKRRNFNWIVGGHRVPQKKKRIVIEVDEYLTFQIVVYYHDIASPLYIDNVNRFRQGIANAENLFDRLGLPPETERPTGIQTPSTGRIYLRKRLGAGSFGEVAHLWNVSTGNEYALKQPSVKAIRERRVDVAAWEEEARIMGQVSQGNHPHIVRLFQQDFSKSGPRLYLKYVPGGTLSSQEDVSTGESAQVLRQLLSALEYLHGLQRPILHRDIKSSNILIQYRYGGEIYVKFADFGLSKEERESGHWSTIYGTYLYIAPKIFEKQKYIKSGGREKKKYTAAIDIWSLRVVVFELLCKLPRYEESYRDQGIIWCEKILWKFQKGLSKRPDELKEFLLNRMVVIDPESRGSARDCHDKMLLLSSAPEDRYQTPTLASYADNQQRMPPYPVGDNDDEDQQTVVFQGARGSNSIDSAEIRRYIRSGNPGPSSHGLTSVAAGKRATRVSKSGRRTKQSNRRSLAVRSSFHGQQDEFESELEQFYQDAGQDPLNSLYVGSSLAELGPVSQSTREPAVDDADDSEPVLQEDWLLQPNWDQPQDPQGSDPRLVGAGLVYTHGPAQAQVWAGRSWGNGGRSWGNGGRSWGNEHAVETVTDSDQEVAARLLLALHEG